MRRAASAVGALIAAAIVAGVVFAFAQHGGGGTSGTQTTAAAPPAVRTTSSGAASSGTTALQAAFENVVKRVSPQVVQIETSQGLGSGIVYDSKGDIVTNAHVTEGASHFTVTYPSGTRKPATLVGSFRPDDLAVIHVDGAPSTPPAHFANSDDVEVGAIVLAIGNPLGLRSSVTQGIVSAFRGAVSEGGGVALQSVIQTSAAINPGNSGGALVGLDGRVVGIPTLAATDPELGGAAAGIGFAIPSNTVVQIANQLVEHGHVVNSHRAYLGIRVGDTIGQNGVYVGDVSKGSPAAAAGMQVGDIILSVDGKPTPTTDELAAVLAGLEPGRTAKIVVQRQDGSKKTLSVKLGTYPGT